MSRNLSVVVYEPNADFLKVIEKSFQVCQPKPAITVAKSEAELVKVLAEKPFDLAVVDHKAADSKGERLVEQMRKRASFPKTKRFLVTSIHLNEAGKPTEIGEIPVTFISKPFRAEILESVLLSILEIDAPMKDPKWKLDARLLNPFIEAVLECCDEMARLSLKKTGVDLKKGEEFCDLSVISVFDQGDLFGAVSVAFPQQTYLQCANKVAKAEERAIHQRNLFVAEDFLNSTLKKIQSALESKKMTLKFRSPVVTMGKKHLAPSIQGLKPIVIHFVSDEGNKLHLELSLQKNWP